MIENNNNWPFERLERCAELAAWHQLETDPAQKERLAAELAQCVMRAAKDDAQRQAEQDAKDKAAAKKAEADKAEKAEKKAQEAKAKEDAETKAKAAEAAEHAAWEKEMLERMERDREQRSMAPERSRELALPIPPQIRESAAYQRILEEQRATQARLIDEQAARYAAEARANNYQGIANMARIEAADAREEKREAEERFEERQDPTAPGIEGEFDPYAKAAQELDAKAITNGQEVEGEVLEVAKVDGQNYYVVEQDGERFAVPAGDKPDYEKGDEITASRSKEGIEVEESYGYGR